MSDLAIPEVKLVQNVGGDEAKQSGAVPGDFYCSLTQEKIPATGFDIVVTGPAQKTRLYWGRDEIDDEPPVCASNDGVYSINGDVCASCPYKAYNDAPYLLDKTARKLACTPNYVVTAIKLDDMMPVLIRCGGISAQAAKELNTLLAFHKAIRNNHAGAKIRVSSIKKKTASGEAYAIKFGNPEPIADEAVKTELKELIGNLKNDTGLKEIEVSPEPVAIPETATPEPAPAATVEPSAPPAPPAEPKEAKPLNLDF